jgi:hypothetical protein
MLAMQISNLHSQIGDALTSISGVLGCSAPTVPFTIFSLILHAKHKFVPCEPTALWTKYACGTCIHMFKKGVQSHFPSTHFTLSAPCWSLPTFLVTQLITFWVLLGSEVNQCARALTLLRLQLSSHSSSGQSVGKAVPPIRKTQSHNNQEVWTILRRILSVS